MVLNPALTGVIVRLRSPCVTMLVEPAVNGFRVLLLFLMFMSFHVDTKGMNKSLARYHGHKLGILNNYCCGSHVTNDATTNGPPQGPPTAPCVTKQIRLRIAFSIA